MPQSHARRRELQAEQTRRDIVQAARRLFVARGYARTSMADIAREAGVAIQTIYASVGPKQSFLRELNQLIDQEAGVAEIVEALAATGDPHEKLRLAVRATRQVVERAGDLVSAVHAGAGTDPEMAAILEEGRRRHREGMEDLARGLETAGALREGMTAERAAQTIAVLSSNEVYFQLTRQFGMAFDEAEVWILSTLGPLVLVPSPPRRGL
ncbi:MAG: TetR/AcrR family transcriptional regulator [Dehalococcoidia bacterium]|nr:MAG: TetR/AcrR family transcriptional regulator [bacterium]MCE7928026.1 TetR/AcrR family transcriptional regulator [Chloroflexi bacterium CFX7]MCK6565370.1 TetR/AcrR family transcriptional regulator [Dehalococcoidia bacterium]MCL4232751.1 TetR family transcriptional regulator [Dehalococcoidia bacterium]NUQ56158.1 TetR/AcrR family transcriptional regulator [Dehalococcoidia bacterium]